MTKTHSQNDVNDARVECTHSMRTLADDRSGENIDVLAENPAGAKGGL